MLYQVFCMWLTLMIGCTLNGMKFVLPPYIEWWWLRTLWNSDGPHWWIYGPLRTNFMMNYTDWRTVVAMGPTFTVSDSAFYQQYIEKSDLQGANQSYRYQRDAKVLLHCCTIGAAPKIFSSPDSTQTFIIITKPCSNCVWVNYINSVSSFQLILG